MERRKLTKEDLDIVRGREGFPNAKDDDIIALSDAPYYCACPNPFIEEFIKEYGTLYDESTDNYHCEPFAADVSEDKSDPIYNAHSYHTKVPYKAIMRYILHYTRPGDIVFDGFCGSGTTGVAAKMCGTDDHAIKHSVMTNGEKICWGDRHSVLSDLSPAASFIAKSFNSKPPIFELQEEANRIIREVHKECDWMYKTKHIGEKYGIFFYEEDEANYGVINYVVWSDVFICPVCGKEVVFWDAALDPESKKIEDSFSCPCCNSILNKRDCSHAVTAEFDEIQDKVISMAKQVPVLINYTWNGRRFEKKPDQEDIELIEKINKMQIGYWFPTYRMPEGDESRRNDRFGITHIYQFFTKRTLYVLASIWDKAKKSSMSDYMMFVMTGLLQISSKQSAFRYDSRNTNNTAGGILKGTLYIPSIAREGSVFSNFERRISAIEKMAQEQQMFNNGKTIIQVSSANNSGLPDNSIDYIFTDPPFGSNINYSDLSFMWEAWLKVTTNNKAEAIISPSQHKGLLEYQDLMTQCFAEYNRILKPNRWMTVEFHNSKNAVWNAIQEALQRAGFVIADVRTLDKKLGSFKQVNTTGAVKQDLIISAYKPKEALKKSLSETAGSEETAWAFVHQHLSNLPVAVVKEGKIEILAERQAFLLFDRMVAYHIMNGIQVPIDATKFYKGLDERYLKRDDMYFLPDQVNEYDTARIINDVEPIQFSFLVCNEKTAIAWLYQQLSTPQTYAVIQPKFMQELKTIDKYEAMPELSVLLEENFLQDGDGKWYVPDVTKEADVQKLREKNLIKEFDGYLATKGKLKLFRTEAIRVGFAKLWKDKNYKLIVETAERLPEQIIQEDDKLLMYYDISLGRV